MQPGEFHSQLPFFSTIRGPFIIDYPFISRVKPGRSASILVITIVQLWKRTIKAILLCKSHYENIAAPFDLTASHTFDVKAMRSLSSTSYIYLYWAENLYLTQDWLNFSHLELRVSFWVHDKQIRVHFYENFNKMSDNRVHENHLHFCWVVQVKPTIFSCAIITAWTAQENVFSIQCRV